MASSKLDLKYALLVDRLQTLTDKLDQFINGDENVTITTGAGTVKSISGIAKDLYKVRALLKIVDHRLLSDAVADSTILDGMFVRVFGDEFEVNGIYKKTSGSLVKMSFVEVGTGDPVGGGSGDGEGSNFIFNTPDFSYSPNTNFEF